jgi:luciferase-type oxidoreductase
MKGQEELAIRAEELGFKALWFRDVPFHDPTFGDVGQMFDSWIYMTHIMNHTQKIAIAAGSIILPLRHPVHVVKSINSIQSLSGGRLILGVASGDRAMEYPALGQKIENKSELFRDAFQYITALKSDFPTYKSDYFGEVNGALDIVPKYKGFTPMLVTGHSGQSIEWIAQHADGWLYYPRDFKTLDIKMNQWNEALNRFDQNWKPFMQSLYIDLTKDETPRPIHLGFKSNASYLVNYLKQLEMYGVNHVIFNLKYASKPASDVIEELGQDVLPFFN